ncbi:MAG: hypothetical protein ACJ768_21510 [Gaiellaceae bacterium]
MIDPPSPPAHRLPMRSRLQPRLVAGVLLIVASVAMGARIVSAADRSVLVWAVTRDVAVGTVLAPEDLRPTRARLFDSASRYLDGARSPAGRAVTRRLSAGELVPAAAVRTVPPAVVVNIPVQPANAPAVTHGQSVDVWASSKDCLPQRVLAGAAVQDVRADGVGALSGTAGGLQVVVRVSAAEAERMLAALSREATIRLVVPEGDPPGRAVTATACVRPGAADEQGGR